MIFKRYRDVLQYIESSEKYIPELTKVKESLTKSLSNGFTLKEIRFVQEKDYSVDIYGKVKPILGEMRDFKTLRTDNSGKEVCEHILTFIVKRLPDGTFITPDNFVFKIEITPKGKELQRVSIVELLEVNSVNDVKMI